MNCPIHQVPLVTKTIHLDGAPIKRKRDGAIVYFCPNKACRVVDYSIRSPFHMVVTTQIEK